MDNLGSILSTALAIVAIASLAAAGLQMGTVKNLRENLGDARAEIADKDRRLSEAERRITELSADMTALQRVVTGEVHWLALGEKLDEHHRMAEVHWTNGERILSDIRDELGKLS